VRYRSDAIARAVDTCESALALQAQAQLQLDRARKAVARTRWNCDGCDALLATSADPQPHLTLICGDCGMTWMSGTRRG
jgi:ribosomal protein S27AE